LGRKIDKDDDRFANYKKADGFTRLENAAKTTTKVSNNSTG